MNEEIWKDVPGYEGIYQVSSFGRILSLGRVVQRDKQGPVRVHKKFLKPFFKFKGGYLVVSLCKNKKFTQLQIHRLVLEAFEGVSPLWVDHINSIRTDNRLINLRYCTSRENTFFHIHKRRGYVGAIWIQKLNRWASRITINGSFKTIGYFNEREQATEAYKKEYDLQNAAVRNG